MAPRPKGVTLNDKRIQALISTYVGAIRKIEKEILGVSSFEQARRAALLASIRETLIELRSDMNKWADSEMRDYYESGLRDAERDLQKLGVNTKKIQSFTLIDTAAVKAITDEVKLGFAESMRGVARSSRRLITEAEKKQVNALLAEGIITGETNRKIAGEIKEILKEQGLTGLVDKRGRRWEIDSYTNMLVRTKAVEARNAGLGNRMAQNGFDLVEVSNHNSSHGECARWEGEVLSYTGATPGYPTYSQALSSGLFHPNCKHAIQVMNPELADRTEAYDNPYNHIDKQIIREADKRGETVYITNVRVMNPNSSNPTLRLFEKGKTKNLTITKRELRFMQDKNINIVTGIRKFSDDPSVIAYYNRKNNAMFIRDINAPDLRYTFYHEFGHAIDREYGKGSLSRGLASSAIKRDSREIQLRRIMLTNGLSQREARQIYDNFKKTGGSSKYINYISKPQEVFAAGYAQYRKNPGNFKQYAPSLYKFFRKVI